MNRENKIFSKVSFFMFILGLILFIIAITLFLTGQDIKYYTRFHRWGWFAWGISFLASIVSFIRKEPGKLKMIPYIGALIFGVIIVICLLYWSFHFVQNLWRKPALSFTMAMRIPPCNLSFTIGAKDKEKNPAAENIFHYGNEGHTEKLRQAKCPS